MSEVRPVRFPWERPDDGAILLCGLMPRDRDPVVLAHLAAMRRPNVLFVSPPCLPDLSDPPSLLRWDHEGVAEKLEEILSEGVSGLTWVIDSMGSSIEETEIPFQAGVLTLLARELARDLFPRRRR